MAKEFSYSPLGPDKLWIFLIDTDSYAGNFEREMCAYMTGRIGDCGVGDEMVERYCKDMGIHSDSEPNLHIVDMPDDRGCSRPASCWVTPGAGACNSLAIFMDRKPTESEVESMIERAKRYTVEVIGEKEDARRREYKERGWDFGQAKKIEILGFRLLLRETTESQVASFPTS